MVLLLWVWTNHIPDFDQVLWHGSTPASFLKRALSVDCRFGVASRSAEILHRPPLSGILAQLARIADGETLTGAYLDPKKSR